MRAAERSDVPVILQDGKLEVRVQEIGGGMSVGFFQLPEGADFGPALVGLPGDSCQCPHWGYVLRGSLRMRTPDGDHVYRAGQAVYWAPGHVPLALEDTEYVDFSPTEEFTRVLDHVAAQGG